MQFGFRFKYYKNMLNNTWKIKKSNSRLNVDYDNTVLFLLACDYNNIGDILIRKSQESFLKNVFDTKQIVTIDYGDTCRFLKDIKERATKNTIIVLTGGGNTGDRYCGTDNYRNTIIRMLRKNECKIIGFPQTVEYTNTAKGRFYLRKAKKAYKSNKAFVFCARERKSLKLARSYFKGTKVCLSPDIVFSYDLSKHRESREGIGLLFRRDGEKVLDDAFINRIVDRFSGKYDIAWSDMSVERFNKGCLKKYLKSRVDFVSKKQLVMTDRLHGMILCYITNTPCIVFPNINHKIEETYNNWLLGKQNFMKLEDPKNLNRVFDDFNKLVKIRYISKDGISEQFEGLKEELYLAESRGKSV